MAAVAVLVGLTLPPPAPLSLAAARPTARFPASIHVHTNRSDGLSGPDEIAAAAARAGLKFVVFTDHGDATRKPDPPAYRSGVLCLDGVEISTNGGHYVALDMPPSPYPLAGEARDVVEDVRRLGGFGIAAHPDSPKPQLRWRDWNAPFDGVEMLNLDTGWRLWAQQAAASAARWRREAHLLPRSSIIRSGRPKRIASLLPAGRRAVARWAALAAAPARRGARRRGRARAARAAQRRSGRQPLRAAASGLRVVVPRAVDPRAARPPLSGDAAADARGADARAFAPGISTRRSTAIATPPSFEFTATNAHGTVQRGRRARRRRTGDAARPQQRAAAFTTTVWSGRERSERGPSRAGLHRRRRRPGPAVYWVEIRATGRRADRRSPWIRSNPIYVRSAGRRRRRRQRGAPATCERADLRRHARPTDGASSTTRRRWPPSRSAPTVGGAELRFRYGLAGGASAGQRRRAGVRHAARRRRVRSADVHHSRRAPDAHLGSAARRRRRASRAERWQRRSTSTPTLQERTIFFDDLTPVGADAHAAAGRRRHPQHRCSSSTRPTPSRAIRGGSGSGKRRCSDSAAKSRLSRRRLPHTL